MLRLFSSESKRLCFTRTLGSVKLRASETPPHPNQQQRDAKADQKRNRVQHHPLHCSPALLPASMAQTIRAEHLPKMYTRRETPQSSVRNVIIQERHR